MYEVISSYSGVTMIEATYATREEAEAHAQRLRNAGLYAAVSKTKATAK